MSIGTFTAEGSLYRGGGYYAGTSASYGTVLNRVWASQVLPICNSGNYTNCGPGTLAGCTTNCVQMCQDPNAPAPRPSYYVFCGLDEDDHRKHRRRYVGGTGH